ncbi:MAG: Gfo/Idh/MocA family oxidoreductase [Ruminococcaceae bacterium]|nr:Gfo/Idh/MocA family oxidoreductase [Oscillospiraceae bacterium]
MAETKDAILNKFESNQEEVVVDTSKKVKVGIIGTGWIAEAHIRSYQNQPDVEVVALADLIPGKAEKFKATWNVEGARCYEGDNAHLKMLEAEQLDAVSVCTYNRTHAVCTIDSLKHGVPVLLEKPMCVTLEEAIEICKAEKETGKIVSVGFQPRFDVNMKQVKAVVESGVLGKIYYIQTGGGRRHGIPTPFGTSFIEDKTAGLGALADIGCYSLDMVLNAIGYPKPLKVSGYKSDFFGKNPEYYKNPDHPEYAELFGVDDFAAAFVRLEGDIILDFRIAWAMNMDTSGDTLIYGTKGGLRIPSTECWNGTIGGPMTIYSDVGGNRVETVIPLAAPDKVSNFDKKIRSFIDAVKTGAPSPVPTSQILYNQAILSGIADSHKAGKEIDIVIPEF